MTVIAMVVTGFLAMLAYGGLLAFVRIQAGIQLDNQLSFTARQVATLIRAGHLETPIVSGNPGLIQVQNDRRQVVAASRSLVGLPALRAKAPAGGSHLFERVCPANRCFHALSMHVVGPDGPLTVYVLAPELGLFPRPGLAVFLALGIPFSIGVAGVWRWWLAARRLRPVELIRAELDEINAADLHRRVSVPPRRDEFSSLVEAVNATLDRLEAAVEQQRRLVSDVSHDLRSPIAGLRAELEAALIDPEGTDLRSALRRTLKNTERLQNIVTELLVLARREAGLPGRTERVDLGELAEREVARRPRRISAKVAAEPGVIARVNDVDVGRVLTNLLDNAARHADSEVIVTVRRERDAAVVEIFNDGEAIAPEDRERIFERFIRLPASRKRDSGGTGLGLAISRDIADAYGGSLELADDDLGTRFVLTLPLLEDPEA
ncbi:sensor histidine kinase [Actinoallomurus acaciae]|uniref:histidine kinase n=1 Tax=Actinoallomurus acaciae TaxID=502577 RepID=A0ABV5YPJ6_9ACTN